MPSSDRSRVIGGSPSGAPCGCDRVRRSFLEIEEGRTVGFADVRRVLPAYPRDRPSRVV